MANTDVQVSFGAETADLAAGIAIASAELKKFQSETNKLASEAAKAGTVVSSELFGKLKASQLATAQAELKLIDLGKAVRGSGTDIKKLGDTVGEAVFQYSPWTGQHVQLAQTIGVTLASALGLATFAFAALGVAAGAALGVITVGIVKLGESTGALAAEFGQSTEAIGRLGSVAGRVGLETKDLGKAFQTLQKNVKDGDEATVAALKALGIGIDQVKGKNFDQLLTLFADRFSKTGDSANKNAAAVALFGQDVADKLVPALNKGVSYLNQVADSAARFGAGLSGEIVARIKGTGEAASKVGDSFHDLGQAFTGLGVSLFQIFKPAIDGVITGFAGLGASLADAVAWITRSINEGGIMRTVLDGIAVAAKLVAAALVLVTEYVQVFLLAGVQAFTQVGNVAAGLADVLKALFKDFGEATKSTFEQIQTISGAAFKFISDTASTVVKAIGDFFGKAGEVVAGVFAAIAQAASTAFGFIVSGASKAAEAVAGLVGQLANLPKIELPKFEAPKFELPELKNTSEAIKRFKEQSKKDFDDFGKGVDAVSKRAQESLKQIFGTGAPNVGARRGPAVGDPSVPKAGKGGRGGRTPADDSARVEQTKIQEEIDALRAGLEAKKRLYENELALKKISEEQKTALVRKAIDEEFQAEKALLEKEANINGLKPAQREAILRKIAQLEQKYAKDVTELQFRESERIFQKWEQTFSQIGSTISSSITGIITGSKRLSDVFRDVANQILNMFVQMGVNILVNNAARIATQIEQTAGGQATETAEVAAGGAARVGVETATVAAANAPKAAAAVKSIASSAVETQAGVTGFLSPILGPLAVPAGIAAGAIVAGLRSLVAFDIGAYNLPTNTLALVHQNELVMPVAQAKAFRSLLENGGAAGGGTYNVSPQVHLNISAMDGASVKNVLMANGGALMKAISAHARDGVHLGIRGLRTT